VSNQSLVIEITLWTYNKKKLYQQFTYVQVCQLYSLMTDLHSIFCKMLLTTVLHCTSHIFVPLATMATFTFRPFVDASHFTQCQMCWFPRQPTEVFHIKSQVLGMVANPVCWSKCELWKIRIRISNKITIMVLHIRFQSSNQYFGVWIVSVLR
jgi:hypothetical protein